VKVQCRLNHTEVEWEVHPGERLLDTLRRHGIYGPKEGCSDGSCGACTVLVNNRPVNSCLILTLRVDGQELTTIEGIGTPQDPHPLQTAFADKGAVQCGYCTPGSILSAYALLQENPNPDEAEIRRSMDGNLCRCTGYVKKLEAVKSVIKS
jgi:aerobic carbon-monoxide dehydrogenase small subunit